LCIEDSAIHLQILCRYLEYSLGCRVRAADGVEQAVMWLLRESFDLVVADIMMPGLDGMDLLTILRAKKDWQKLPVVIVSAMGDLGHIETLNGLGISDYIVKPFDPVVAVPRLRRLLERLPLETAPRPRPAAPLDGSRIPILLASTRAEVIDAIRRAAEPSFDVSVVDSGPAAVIKGLEIQPWVVFLTEDLATWDTSTTLQKLLALKTLEGIRVIPLRCHDRDASTIIEAVRRDLSVMPFTVAPGGKATTVTLHRTFRASCLGALKAALSGTISRETQRVVFELPSGGIGKDLSRALEELARHCKLRA
jgi:CheY-like chemotaxis protein